MDFVRHLDKISLEKYHIDKLRAMLQTDEYLPKWAALKNFLSRRWWSRMWSVQEFVLPPSISFWCGTRNASRVAVCRTLSTADKCTSVGIKQTPGFTLGNNRRRARGLYKAMRDGKANVILSLPALATYFSCMNATDDRDRLYALMGLCTDKSLLEVDYFLNTEEVYLGFAQAFITQYKSLDIISFASIHSGPSESWPSWVPRWQKGEALAVPLMVSQSSKTQIGNLRTPPALEVDLSVYYTASGNTEAICKFEGSRLLARGVVIDTVDGLAASKHFDLVQSSTWTSGEMPDSFFSPKDILTSVCRSLVLDRKDRYLRYSMPTAEFSRDFLQLVACLMTETHRDNAQELQEWFSWTINLQIQGHSFENIVHQMLRIGIDTQDSTANQDEYYHDTFFGRFFDKVVRMSLRLMVTRAGHVGMVAEKAKKGDLVCMFKSKDIRLADVVSTGLVNLAENLLHHGLSLLGGDIGTADDTGCPQILFTGASVSIDKVATRKVVVCCIVWCVANANNVGGETCLANDGDIQGFPGKLGEERLLILIEIPSSNVIRRWSCGEQELLGLDVLLPGRCLHDKLNTLCGTTTRGDGALKKNVVFDQIQHPVEESLRRVGLGPLE
ncbi:hypothetical protein HG530_000501 [Fusarium avenaceum]|nr:hypothetical protein HG530_000501 [Fusarium avenaceum]